MPAFLFNGGAFTEDTMLSGRAGAKALQEARSQFEQHGIEIKACAAVIPKAATGRSCPAASRLICCCPNDKVAWSFASSAMSMAWRFATSCWVSDITRATRTRRPSTRSLVGSCAGSPDRAEPGRSSPVAGAPPRPT